MGKAKLLPITAEAPGTDVIERLEEALERARNGEISSVAISLVFRDGGVSGSWSAPPNRYLLIGAVERTKYRLLRAAEE